MNHCPKSNEEEDYKSDPKSLTYKEIISTLPRRKGYNWVAYLYQYKGFWYGPYHLDGILSTQDHFKSQPNEVIISSVPKSGTTWLKSLNFAIMTRSCYNESTSPLLTQQSHDLLPFFELEILSNPPNFNVDIPLVATHIPYTSLPKSIMNSSCKIVYICRDPKDVFDSLWHYSCKVSHKDAEPSIMEDLDLGKGFEFLCEGESVCGPYWDHVLGYWRANLESPK
uniref:Sulfotransferase n=2 Tax=Quercus lobata TaxID=97700 RepID=A0A7N2MSC9_QUELO